MDISHLPSSPAEPEVSVLISTYNSPEWLRLVLWGYAVQSFRDFEVVVADDGSTVETRDLIDEMRTATGLQLRHVWHEDQGFRKNRILNEAIRISRGRYIIGSDGDCIPRADFVEAHLRRRKKGFYLSGGYVKLPASVSQSISVDTIRSGDCFRPEWLRARGLRQGWRSKTRARGTWAWLLNTITPTARKWNGHNASGWREDIEAVNGYDDRMGYGACDTELGYRLRFHGVRGRQIRYLAVCLHLAHDRPYRTVETTEANRSITAETLRLRREWTPSGLTVRE